MRRYLLVANQTLGGRRLLDRVRELQAAGDCRFHALVPATPPREHLPAVGGDAETLARERLERARSRFAALGIELTGSVGAPDPLRAVEDALRDGEYDEILLSTLPGGLSRWLGRDLPNQMQRAFDLPVTVVEAEPEVIPRGPVGGIVVGVDGSEASRRALRWALEEARLRQARLDVVHVFPPPTSFAFGEAYVEPPPRQVLEDEAREIAHAALADVLADEDPGVPLEVHLLEGHPARVLLSAAQAADLLVVASRGRGGFQGLILGSVSQQCVQHAACPVVVIPPEH